MATNKNNLKILKDQIGDSGNTDNLETKYATTNITTLSGQRGSKEYLNMTADAYVGAITQAYKTTILSCDWDIVCSNNADEKTKKATEIIKYYFFNDSESKWLKLLPQILTLVEFGFSTFEIILNTYNYKGEQKYIMPTLEQRWQPSIVEIDVDIQTVRQQRRKGGEARIPFDKMLFFILSQYGDDMRGRSVLYSAHEEWLNKKQYVQRRGIGLQRATTGIPDVEVPEGVSVEDEEYQAMETLVKRMYDQNQAYIMRPAGWTLNLLQNKFDSKIFSDAINECNTAMITSVLLQFLMLGQNGNGGSYGLGQDQSDFFLDGIGYVVNVIKNPFNSIIIKKIVELNFEGVDYNAITLVANNLNKSMTQEFGELLDKLTDKKWIFPTLDDEVKIRSQLDMHTLTDEQLEINKTYREKMLEEAEAPEVKKEEKKSTNVEDSIVYKFAEKKISKLAKERKQNLDDEAKVMNAYMQEQLNFTNQKLKADIRTILESGKVELKGLKDIELRGLKQYQAGLKRKMAGIADLGWNQEKKKAKRNKVKLSEELSPTKLPDKQLQAFVINQADMIVEDQTTALKSQAIYNAQSSVMRGKSIDQTMASVNKVTEEFIEGSKVSAGSETAVTMSMNYGMNAFNNSIKEELWGYEFIAVDDGRTTEICLWYNGKTFSVDSAELIGATPPLHSNCRSWLEPLYKGVDKKPDKLDDVVAPPSIQKQGNLL